MYALKKQFIELALANNVLQFGEFVLKSGRVSPYFFNAGLFYTASALRTLGACYAETILANTLEFDHLFGPAYKGLPLATAVAIALNERGVETTVTFNRKEAKDHGEGGELIGAPLFGNTLIIDDVITAGTAIGQAQQFITRAGGKLSAVIVALDRGETNQAGESTVMALRQQGIAVYSIITIHDLIDYLQNQGNETFAERLLAYRERYGV